MKVLLINGSPREKGCTYTALNEIVKTLNEEGVSSEIFHIGNKPIQGCTSCRKCMELGKCVFDDAVNEIADKAKKFDGFIIGSPVYYAAANGALLAFLNRLFCSNSNGKNFAYKPGAAVVSARRAGTTAALEQINKYFSISKMPIVSSQYWNMVHGSTPEDVLKDLEGLQTMRVLARNMAWIIKCFESGKKSGVPMPKEEPIRERTGFLKA